MFAIFDQSPFYLEDSKIFDYGMIYIPDACLNQSCDFHIHFHGCGESVALWDTLYARQTGILEHAAANDMIVLFP